MVSVHGATVQTYLNNPQTMQSLFTESNCFPLQSFFFQQLSYLMYDVHAETAPKSLLDKFAKINTKHHYNTQLSLELKK